MCSCHCRSYHAAGVLLPAADFCVGALLGRGEGGHAAGMVLMQQGGSSGQQQQAVVTVQGGVAAQAAERLQVCVGAIMHVWRTLEVVVVVWVHDTAGRRHHNLNKQHANKGWMPCEQGMDGM